MHQAAYDYVQRAIKGLDLEGKRVLEIGSLDINNTAQNMSIRDLCGAAKEYHGIDIRKGLGVDQVAQAADYDGKGKYDLVITTEVLEHAADPESVIACAERALRPGGQLILTAAAPERPPHGWHGGLLGGDDTYQAIAPSLLRAWLADWEHVKVRHNETAGDVYAVAVKREAEPEKPAKKGDTKE